MKTEQLQATKYLEMNTLMLIRLGMAILFRQLMIVTEKYMLVTYVAEYRDINIVTNITMMSCS